MKLTHKLIIYDSQCQVCTSLKNAIVRFTSIPESQIVAYNQLPSHLLHKVDINQFKNGMAIIDTAEEETLYGPAGVAFIFSAYYPVIRFLFRFAWLYACFIFLYKILAYNRYIIALPKTQFKCDCYPDRVVKYRIAYILIALFIGVMIASWIGYTLQSLDYSIYRLSYVLPFVMIASWIIQSVTVYFFSKKKVDVLEYAGHLASILVVSLMLWVPWIILEAVINKWVVLVVSIISVSYMGYLHVYRSRYLGLPLIWTAIWLVMYSITYLFFGGFLK